MSTSPSSLGYITSKCTTDLRTALVLAKSAITDANNTIMFMENYCPSDDTVGVCQVMKESKCNAELACRELEKEIACKDASSLLHSMATFAALVHLAKDAHTARTAEESAIRSKHNLKLDDDKEGTWFIPPHLQTREYIYYDRLEKDAPAQLMAKLHKACAAKDMWLQLSADARSCNIELEVDGESKDMYLSIHSILWGGGHSTTRMSIWKASSLRKQQDLLLKSEYPIEVKAFVSSQIDTYCAEVE